MMFDFRLDAGRRGRPGIEVASPDGARPGTLGTDRHCSIPAAATHLRRNASGPPHRSARPEKARRHGLNPDRLNPDHSGCWAHHDTVTKETTVSATVTTPKPDTAQLAERVAERGHPGRDTPHDLHQSALLVLNQGALRRSSVTNLGNTLLHAKQPLATVHPFGAAGRPTIGPASRYGPG
jgi:hypothetical protein